MKPKAIIKICVDGLMTAALLFVSGYQLWGEKAHEWAGAFLFVLFIAHYILNMGWYRRLFHGRYTPMRILQLVVDMALLAVMLMQMYSGIVMSRHVFAFLPLESGMGLARSMHILGAYWGILLMSLHLGLHWNMFLGMGRKAAKIKDPSRVRAAICRCAGLLIALYGAFAFADRELLTYMLLRSEFVFLDYSEPPLFFYMDYLAIMGMCIFAGHYASKLLRKIPGKQEERK